MQKICEAVVKKRVLYKLFSITDNPDYSLHHILDRQQGSFSIRLIQFAVSRSITGNPSCHKPLDSLIFNLCLANNSGYKKLLMIFAHHDKNNALLFHVNFYYFTICL